MGSTTLLSRKDSKMTTKGLLKHLEDHPHWSLDDLVARYKPSLPDLYREHVSLLTQKYSEYLTETLFDAVVIDAGVQRYYFADDRGILFAPTPHFAHWMPLPTPGHLLIARPGMKPLLCVYAPKDYWHEDPTYPLETGAYRIGGAFGDVMDLGPESFEIRLFDQMPDLVNEAKKILASQRVALVGPMREEFKELGWSDNPKPLLARLDWTRTTKTHYELTCLWIAQCSGVRGHWEVAQRFEGGGAQELDLHLSFLKGAQISEDAAPYGSIVALNERGRILHYQYKKTLVEPSFSLLIDAGSRFRSYPSDITRTYAGPRASRAFRDLLRDVDTRQQHFVEQLALGTSFVEMHQLAHRGLAQVLIDHGVIRGLTSEAAVSSGLTRVFFPHGLGHHLGIQVHDVGSRQLDPAGTEIQIAADIPGGRYLRNIRPLAEGHVVTIEPGIYFIPILINEALAGAHGSYLNQALIRDLMPHGGIRIEDDIYMTPEGPLNLTRMAFEMRPQS